MSYDSTRISEQLRVLEPAISEFIVRYNINTVLGPAGGGPRQTVFIFPGGMASRLMRAKTPYVPGVANQIFDYDEAWINPFTFLGDARHLKMTRAGSTHSDKWNKIIVADGLINLFGVTPYVLFTLWCTLKKLDYFVFPWDWRRSVAEVSDFFIATFLPFFRDLVKAGCNNADPLQRFSLIGHSAGGMVVNWALRSGDGLIIAGLDKAITVATPFYGYGGQLHRWFEGEEYLNGLGNVFRSGIIKAICSFPGCYAWMFLPEATYLANQGSFNGDPNYPLAVYPSVDFAAGGHADPYNPLTNGAQHRYPSATSSGFDDVELASAKLVVDHLSSPLGAGQAAQLWNIRGDTLAGNTHNRTRWKWVPPTAPSPINDVDWAAGDGVQPAWTARHVDLDAVAGHVITIKSPLATHTTLMSLPETIAEIAGILGVP
jgi:hypothetical protein